MMADLSKPTWGTYHIPCPRCGGELRYPEGLHWTMHPANCVDCGYKHSRADSQRKRNARKYGGRR